MNMTEEERKAAAGRIFESAENTMSYLISRWQDEKEFEPIKDYGLPLQPIVEKEGGQFLKMTARPFGFTYLLAGCTYRVTITLGGKYVYKRIE